MHHIASRRRPPFELRQVVSSLRERNYRLYFAGQLISVAGTWMQTVAQSFLVLRLDEQWDPHSGLPPWLAFSQCSSSAR